MYESYFGFRDKPFALTPDPAFLYPTRYHRLGLSTLVYGVMSSAGFTLLTGEVGCGKTTLVRQLLQNLDTNVTVGLISNTNRSFGKLLQWICLAFGLKCRNADDAELYQRFVDYLVAQYAAGQRVLLIVDEAQNLDAAMLEELRVLSNVNADKHLVLQTLLVGQPELRATLKRPDLRQFAQRISIDYHLPVLRRADVQEYVRHRLRVAGGDPELISSEAIDLAWMRSGGVPRLVNQLCDQVLVYAFADQVPAVDAALMRQVIEDRGVGGLLPDPAAAVAGV